MSKKKKNTKNLKVELIEALILLALAIITGTLHYLEQQKDDRKDF